MVNFANMYHTNHPNAYLNSPVPWILSVLMGGSETNQAINRRIGDANWDRTLVPWAFVGWREIVGGVKRGVTGGGSGTVNGRNPAPVDMYNILLFIGFHTSQVVQDFSHQQ